MSKFWNFKNKSDNTGELLLYGDISSVSWFGDEITPKDFKKDLDALGDVKNLDIFINSGGGDVFAGQAIYSMLKRHSAFKTVYVDGLAASIAALISQVGDVRKMPKNAMMMIHNSWTIAIGNSALFRKMADDMDKIDESIRGVFIDKTGLDQKEITDLMDAETWMTAEEAVKRGFADEVEEEKKLAASMNGGFFMLNGQQFDLAKFKNPPPIQEYQPIDNGGVSQPAAISPDHIIEQRKQFAAIRTKIINAY
jgi:ATP-dependent Clp protease protease subunit